MKRFKRKQKEEKQQVNSVDVVIKKQNDARTRFRITHAKPKIFILAILVSILIVFIGYFKSDASKVQGVVVGGNYYLTKEEVLKICGLTNDSKYWLNFENYLETELIKNQFIESADVTKRKDGIIEINIEEKKIIGYRFITQPEIILKDGSVAAIEEDKIKIIASLPFIDGFESDEILAKVCKGLSDVDENIYDKITEIHQLEHEYDDTMMHIVTSDGIHLYTGVYGLTALSSYNGILSKLHENNKCVYIDDMTLNAWSDDCSSINPPDEEDVTIDGEDTSENDESQDDEKE